MDKIKVEKNNIENAKIRFNGLRLNVKPFISTFETMAIVDACLQALEENYQLNRLPLIKTMFDMAVVVTCTDLLVDGVGIDRNEGNIGFRFDIDAKKVEEFECLHTLNDLIFDAVKNYKDTYECLLKTIELNNIGKSISETILKMPDFEQVDKNLENAINQLKTLEKEKPELVQKVMSHGLAEGIKETTREELKKTKENKKGASNTKKEGK